MRSCLNAPHPLANREPMLGSKVVRSPARAGRTLRRSAPARDTLELAARLDRLRGVEPHPGPRSPVEVLATRSDLAGSVAVAEVLSNDEWPPAEPRVDDGRWLANHVRVRLESSGRWLEKTLADPTRGRSPLPGAARIHRAVTEESARPGRPDDWLVAIADNLGRVWAHRCLAVVRTLRREAARLRKESAADLFALGPQAARLERLDAALRRSLAAARGDADQALADRFGGAFAALLVSFVEAQEDPSTLELGAVEHFLRAGPAAELRSDLDGALRAAFREERALLESLVRACIDRASTASEEAHPEPEAAPAAESQPS